MKKLIASVLALIPMLGMAQNNVWEIPDQPQQQAKVTQKKVVPKIDRKYLEGAVPEVNGEVIFTLDKDVPGMSADSIYDKVYSVISSIVEEGKSSGLQPQARIAAVNKAEHTIAARVKEWLLFTSNFISLDRTELNYTLIATASDGHVNVKMQRISYAYETNRKDASGIKEKAENWITDKNALNKKKNKLSPISGKFRRKTMCRKDNIFQRICQALNVTY
ncbi:MAG TPA: hypothetical protein DEQ17_03970 [Prevotella sp.]|nr:hypothetical protein [Prevotella sp.]